MSAASGIQWTDATWNPVVGCERVSPGCAHCYAKAQHDMRHAARKAGKHVPPQYAHAFEVVQLKPERLVHPFSWRAPRRIFVNSVADLFHDAVPFTYIAAVFGVMAATPRHTFQVLTKRPARMLEFFDWLPRHYTGPLQSSLTWYTPDLCARLKAAPEAEWPLPNVWLGVSVENQRWADERIPLLAQAPAAVRFLSCEPLLGPLTLDFEDISVRGWDGRRIDWVIVGGESGTGARPLDVRWVESIVAQCKAAGVAVFVKQLGAVPMEPEADWRGRAATRLLNAKNRDRVPSGFAPLLLRDSHGGEPSEWPAELRVREFPASEVGA